MNGPYADVGLESGLRHIWYGNSGSYFEFHAYVDPDGYWTDNVFVNPGFNAAIGMRGTIDDNNGTINFTCGTFSAAEFNREYLPAACQTLW